MGQMLTFEWPPELDAAVREAGYTPEQLGKEAARLLAADLFQKKVLSLGQAARLAGMPLGDFIPFLGEHGIPYVDYTEDELKREMETAAWVAQKLKE